MNQPKRICCAILGQPMLHESDDIYICGLPECRKPHPDERYAPGPGRPLIPYLPLCGSHRAIAEVKSVRVFVEESIGEFRL